jgi:hypothetical protein
VSNPKFRSLDIVLIGDRTELVADDSAGHEGVIRRVRSYDDGRLAYEIVTLDEDLVEFVPGIYRESDLVSTGRVAPFDSMSNLAEDPSPTGTHVDMLDSDGKALPGRGFTIIDDLSDRRETGG